MLSRRSMLAAPMLALAPAVRAVAAGRMTLCMHSNTSSAGYRAALEGWAKAGITQVELSATVVDEFLKSETMAAARRVLDDNGLTLVHGAVTVNGLLEPNPDRGAALDLLKRRLEMFAALGLKKVYTTSAASEKISLDEYGLVADHLRALGEAARAFEMVFSVEFVRTSPYMSTLPTALRILRQAAHPNVGVVFDFYHFWSGPNRLEDMDQIRPGEIQHVHFQDVPDLPRELLDNTSRAIPGDGVAPVVPTLRRLADKGYAGPLSVELFLPRLRNGDPFAVAQEIRRKCEAVLGDAQV